MPSTNAFLNSKCPGLQQHVSMISEWRQKYCSYQYEPLKYQDEECVEFRLLTLYPGTKDSRVRATLWHTSLHQPPLYEALSYVWGNPMCEEDGTPVNATNLDMPRFIRLDNHSFAVGQNLHSALQHLRHESKPRTLWVDALCIDQDNMYERGRQVRIMDQIYAEASLVLAWLGEADDDTDTAMDAIMDICWAVKARLMGDCAVQLGIPLTDVTNQRVMDIEPPVFDEEDRATTGPFAGLYSHELPRMIECLDKVNIDIPSYTQSIDDIVAKSFMKLSSLLEALLSNNPVNIESPLLKITLAALSRFFYRRTYWNRLWILQELYSARDLQLVCGSRCLDFTAITLIEQTASQNFIPRENVVSAIILKLAGGDFHDAIYSALDPVLPTISIVDSVRDGWPARLFANLRVTRYHSCTEPVDKIFSLLNISEPIKVQPDYGRPVADIFIDTTKAIIEQEQSLNILCFAIDMEESRRLDRLPWLELPSFVPHYEALIRLPTSINPFAAPQSFQQDYDCGGAFLSAYLPNVYQFEDERNLFISGCSWGKVVSQSRGTQYFDTDREIWADVHGQSSELFNAMRFDAGNKRQGSAVDGWKALFEDLYPPPSANPLLTKYIRISRDSEAEAFFMANLNEAIEHDNPSDSFLGVLCQGMRNRAAYLTDQGDLVKAPNTVRVGDEVFVARGCSCAMILRQASETKASAATSEAARANLQIREFVAGAYVHGIMDGEARKKMDDGEVEEIKVLLV
ncbi:MAG: hypothetical protein Q9181_004030 [Wetmoreana brouardii]